MLSVQQIHYILQLSESANFSKAAEACFITQPTLSMQIKKAEEVLGFPIFDRDKTPLSPTRIGKELINILKEVDFHHQQITTLYKKTNGTYTEELVIGIIPTISSYLVPSLYGEWKKTLTKTRLTIHEWKTNELLEALNKRQIDLAILAGPVEEKKWVETDLFTEELMAYVKKSKAKKISPHELEHMKPWLLNKGNCLRSQMMQFCRLNDRLEDEWSFEGGNIDLLMKMVDRNGGYTLIPQHYAVMQTGNKGSFLPVKDEKSKLAPARSVIALHSLRSTKQSSIRIINRSIQSVFDSARKKNYSIVRWKA